jgi:TRAP-type C4-dicarboxylate transport system permease large subunit
MVVLTAGVLGAIFAGIATATESAALGTVGAILIAFIWGDLTIRKLIESLHASVISFATISFLLVGGVMLAQALAMSGIVKPIFDFVTDSGMANWMILILLYGVFFILGCFFSSTEMILISLPITYPVILAMGYDPIWWGIVMVILIEVALLTPPVGLNLFVLVGMGGGKVSLGEASVACVPYWVLLLIGLALFTVFPSIVMVLPNM